MIHLLGNHTVLELMKVKHSVTTRHAFAPAPGRACTSASALGVGGAPVRAQWVLGFVIIAGVRFRLGAARVALTFSLGGACASALAHVVSVTKTVTHRVLRLVNRALIICWWRTSGVTRSIKLAPAPGRASATA